MNRKYFLFIALFVFVLVFSSLLFSSLVLADSAPFTYYADISITVDKAGLTSISGTTNNDNLSVENSPLYTSKKGSYWVFHLNPQGIFSNAIYEINLPEGSSVTYMKLPSFSRVENTGSGLTLVGTAQNQLLNLTVQYEILDVSSDSSLPPWWFMVIVGLLISAGVAFIKKKFSKKKSSSADNNINKNNTTFEKKMIKFSDSLSDRQKEIISLIKKSESGSITQAELEKITGFPKSSLSRNVDSLVRKELIVKKQTGMSNTLSLKDDNYYLKEDD